MTAILCVFIPVNSAKPFDYFLLPTLPSLLKKILWDSVKTVNKANTYGLSPIRKGSYAFPEWNEMHLK